MSKARRWSVLGAVTVLATLAWALPAEASGFKAVCAVDAFAKVTDKDDPSEGFRLVGGKGTFMATGTLTCTGVEKGTPAVVILTITTSGTYESVVCGTFKGQGTGFDVTSLVNVVGGGSAAKYDALLSGKRYAMEVVGGVELFYWHDSDKDTPDTKVDPFSLDPDKDGSSDSNWDLAGVLVPTIGLEHKPSAPGPGSCAKAGRSSGVLTIDES